MYIYKALSIEKPIYIGISININQRMIQHKRESEWYGKHDRIEFAKLPNEFTAKMYEIYQGL